MSARPTTHARGDDFLGSLTEPVRSAVLRRVRTIRLAKGRTLVEKDSSSTDVFLLREGTAQVVLYSPAGREVWVNTAGPGDLIGEIAALDGLPRSSSVVALSELLAIAMPAADFLNCLETSPAAAMWLTRRLAARMRALTEQVYELSLLNVQTRIQRELLRLARTGELHDGVFEIRPAPTHAELASRIGTHREAVTREMRALSRQNIIRCGRRSLTIIDLERLERVTRP